MRSPAEFPHANGIYLISDRQQVPAGKLAEYLIAAAHAGVAAIQIREKDLPAADYEELARSVIAKVPSGVPILLNRRVDLVVKLGAAGVQLGTEVLSELRQIRQSLPTEALIGISCHSLNELRIASQLADFITLSPFFPTSSKPQASHFQSIADLLAWQEELRLPIYPLGGIGVTQAKELAAAGIHRLACIQAVLTGKNSGEVVSRVTALRQAILSDRL